MQYVVYRGSCFTIEWYFDSQGKSDVKEYFDRLSRTQKQKFLYLVKRMGDAGKIYDKTKFRYEGDNIYAFKPQPDRFLCFFYREGKIIITNGFFKKQQKLPLKEKERALKYRQDYEQRVDRGTYYE